ncbi:MAG: hypothetical protein HY720_01975 [Planctomycetes bacterium]|nr:hypothetical protein [Planctomycetota bacterium]
MIRFLLSYLIALLSGPILLVLALATGLMPAAPLTKQTDLETYAFFLVPLAALIGGGLLGGVVHGFLESRLGKSPRSTGR